MSAITPAKYSTQTKRLTLRWSDTLENFSRRVLDILASIFGLLFLAPAFLLVAIIIRRDSPGSIFYRRSRAGKNGREFGILKFRTMYERPASYKGPSVTSSDDDRVTPFGRWLRDTKLNELPQLWNVLVGDMSLVGPRPEDFKIASQWPDEIRKEILSVRPGVTSPASIIFREEEKLLSTSNLMEDYLKKILPSKLRLDVLYVRRRNLLNDLDVIFLTFIALLPRLRKKSIPENILFYGPLNQFLFRFLNWFIIDWIVSSIAVIFSGIVWRLSEPLNVGVGSSLVLAFLIALVFSFSNVVLQMNRISWRSARAEAALDLGFSTGLALLALLVIDHFAWSSIHLPFGMLILMGLLSFFGFIATRYRERILTGIASRWFNIRGQAQAIGERVLIIGAGEMGALVSWFLKHVNFLGHSLLPVLWMMIHEKQG
jgi:lipopolysaccharide/colanic/teichoic acid biosynthesis glycosyltransferase